MPTTGTRDVHTSRILFDWNFTLGTWLRILLNPKVTMLSCGLDLAAPVLHLLAIDWLVSLLVTSEAECRSTVTYDIHNFTKFAFKHH